MARITRAEDITEIGGIPALRLRLVCDLPPNRDRDFVVYWMTAARRTRWNFAFQRAIGWARQLRRPLLVVESLACGGTWDTDRSHRFVLQGMSDNCRRLSGTAVLYHPYVEKLPGDCRKLAVAIGERACVVVTDDYPIALPAAAAVENLTSVRLEAIDGNGLLPMRVAERAFVRAHDFRRFLQRNLREHLLDAPRADPLAAARLSRLESLPDSISKRWPAASPGLLAGESAALARLPIDHGVTPVGIVGGEPVAAARLKVFLASQLASYAEARNEPDSEATSGLAPYLHYGHISVHEIFHRMVRQAGWSPDRLVDKATGSREGWWGMSKSAEAFLDQVVTWRELGFNACLHTANYNQYESLPDWAKTTLAKHASDPRPYVYSREAFAAARTGDRLWNAAQRQLLTDGRIHNYLRMLWGKKIVEWTAGPKDALDLMIELNNRFALDGQDPNSYSGIFWILGRYDRPWGPERPIFGFVRYMSSQNTARKVRVKEYMARYGTQEP